MFGPPGRAYVYFVYGNHFCVNAVCRGPGQAEAVLIRAVEAQFGLEILRRNRPGHADVQLTNGPGKLCAALGIQRELDGADLCDAGSPLLLARHPNARQFRQRRGPVVATPRVGIARAADLPLRFSLARSPYLSRRIADKPDAGPSDCRQGGKALRHVVVPNPNLVTPEPGPGGCHH
jgi:DNA-3-methyladenine glycosylase